MKENAIEESYERNMLNVNSKKAILVTKTIVEMDQRPTFVSMGRPVVDSAGVVALFCESS